MGLAKAKVPVVVASSLICLAAGLAIGVGGMFVFGDEWIKKKPAEDQAQAGGPEGGGPGGGRPGGPGGGRPGGPGGGMGGPGGPGGGMGGPGGGGRGPSPKMQLATLVTKLDVLTASPLELKLDVEQKKKVEALLQGLDAADELSDDDAQKKLDAILDVVKSQKSTLEAAGYRWPGDPGFGGGGRADPPKNPFKEGKAHDQLKDLQKRIEATKTE